MVKGDRSILSSSPRKPIACFNGMFSFVLFFFFHVVKKETNKQFQCPSALWIIHVTHVHVCGTTLLLYAKTLFLGQVKWNIPKGKSEDYQVFVFSCKSAQKKLSHRGCMLTGMISSWNFGKKTQPQTTYVFWQYGLLMISIFSHLLNYVW